MILIEDDQMIKTFSANTSNYSFRIRILERRLRRRKYFFDPHAYYPLTEILAVNAVSIAYQVLGSLLVREGFDDLLRGPFGRWMLGHIEVHDLSPTVQKDNEAVQNVEIDCWDSKKVDGGDLVRVIGEKCFPSLRWRLGAFHPIFRNSLFRYIELQEAQLRLNSGGSPQWVLARYSADQLANIFVDWWTADRRFRLPAPIETEAFSMPFDDCIRFNNDQRVAPILPES